MVTGLKRVIGIQSGNIMGISAIYNSMSYPDMGIGKIAIRRILCDCNRCLKQLDSVW